MLKHQIFEILRKTQMYITDLLENLRLERKFLSLITQVPTLCSSEAKILDNYY